MIHTIRIRWPWLLPLALIVGILTGVGSLPFASVPEAAAATSLTGTWQDPNPSDHDGFALQRKLGTTGTYADIATVGPTVLSYDDPTVTAAATYCYRVAAYNAAGRSPYSAEACSTAPTPTVDTLTLSNAGGGTVYSSPSGISCGATCSATYAGGTTVALSATPAAGYTFAGWSGACSGTGVCTLIMSQNQAVTGTFTAIPPATYALTVTKAGSGSGTVTSTPAGLSCGNVCSASYTTGTSITLTAAPTAGSTFTGWTGGGCTGTGPCTTTVTAAKTVTATFASGKAALTAPTPGSTFTGPSATFTWSAGIGATDYVIKVGTTLGGAQILNADMGLGLTATVRSLPTDGAPIFVRLYTRVETVTLSTDYTFTAAAGSTFTIWNASAKPTVSADPDASAVELGVKFRATAAGTITGIRFYKGSTNTGTHVGHLWTSTGTLLATVTFTSETASGWQQATFATPVAITANTTYVASYHTTVGHYAGDNAYFASTGVTNGPLTALANGVDGVNGLYQYGVSSSFPNQTWNASNYWVDVVFRP